MSAHARTSAAPPRVLNVRRPLVRPAGDPRRLLQAMRRLVVRRAFLVGGVLVAVCLLRVWLSLQVVNVGYQLSAMRKVQEKLEAEQRNLAAELAHLRSPALLGDVARTQLGLGEPRRGQLVEVDR
jgi:hypothetical protein